MQPKANGFEGFGPLAQGLAIGIPFVHGEAVSLAFLGATEQSDRALFREQVEDETVNSSATVIYPAAFAGRASASMAEPPSSAGAADTGSVAQFDLQGTSSMPGSDDLTDKKIELVEAHTDTKIERLGGKLGGKIDVLITKIDSLKDDVSKSGQYNRNTKLAVISTIVGVGLASAISISLLIIALATYGDALFEG
jgi:hypothetical protein